ncbi:protein of unknown function DUF58 [Opitutus terrae PB90-1]|uniref:DUF58 domain-containing protein n=2 Tax=Opitutus terrae TaxID=107709 RepID=B1ZQS7_OPITP|nr:protein of unknown function DUF58 [Opitutus terrae PB90-1]
MVFPRRRQRVWPTISGTLLIALSLGVGLAAYNAANNILFITLALLLACLVLSGVLSWLNFRRVDWQLEIQPPVRAGQDAVVALQLANTKRWLPVYGLWFDFVARSENPSEVARAETTFTARSAEVKAALAQAAAAETRERVRLRARLDPGARTRLEWSFAPRQRGRLHVRLEGVGSLYPFGFLQKQFTTDAKQDVVVWPAPVEYRRFGAATARRLPGGDRAMRAGSGTDLFALRRYEVGDSHRLIHWKASARTRQLLVRQFAAESAEGFSLWLQTDAAAWPRAEQFERGVSFAATLAEDLFRMEKLSSVALNSAPPRPVRGLGDLEAWLDELALVQPVDGTDARARAAGPLARRRSLVTFVADGPHGVIALCDGERMAAT